MSELPAAIEAEQALLGAVLVNNEAYGVVAGQIEDEHFIEPLHRSIWKACEQCISQGRSANPVTVKQYLPTEQTVVDGLSVGQYIARLAAEAVTVINAPDYAAAVRGAYCRRVGLSVAEKLNEAATAADRGYASDAAFIEDLDAAIETLQDVRHGVTGREEVSGQVMAERYYATIDPQKREVEGNIGVPIGLRDLQTVLSDKLFRAGRLVGIVSASGEGKTSLALQLAYHALLHKHPVVIVSYDQSWVEFEAQLVAQVLGIDFDRQINRELSDDELERCYRFSLDLAQLPLTVLEYNDEETIKQVAPAVKRALKKFRDYSNTPLIILDHIQAVGVPSDYRNQNEGKIGRYIGGQVKNLVKQCKAAGLVLQQRNTGGTKRQNPRPAKSDAYGGQGALQPYDALFYLFRPEVYRDEQLKIAATDKEKEQIENRWPLHRWEGKAEIGPLKVRFGSAGRDKCRYLLWDGEHTRYKPLHADEESEEILPF